jgi:hypothetical protein
MRLFSRCVLLTIVVLGSVSAQSASKRSLVANLKNNTVAEGCGCYFRFRGTPQNAQHYLFFSSIADYEKTAWMNIEGRDLKLSLTRKTDPQGRARIGGRSTRRYITDDISVGATYIATRVCKRDDESCESTDYSVALVVRKGTRVQVLKAVGVCGC